MFWGLKTEKSKVSWIFAWVLGITKVPLNTQQLVEAAYDRVSRVDLVTPSSGLQLRHLHSCQRQSTMTQQQYFELWRQGSQMEKEILTSSLARDSGMRSMFCSCFVTKKNAGIISKWKANRMVIATGSAWGFALHLRVLRDEVTTSSLNWNTDSAK